MKKYCRVFSFLFAPAILAGLLLAPAAAQTQLLWQNFDDLARGDSVDELDDAGAPIPDVWSQDAPAGWVIDNTGDWTSTITETGGVRESDDVGVTEWEGWTFVDPAFWDGVAGQDRSLFTKGSGLIAVADGDEWDDIGSAASIALMDTTLTTPAIDISGFADITLDFDSSWRSEEPQEGTVTYSLDGGPDVELLHYVGGTTADLFDEHKSFSIPSGGADSMTVSWRYFNADNDWWFAIDNIHVEGVPEPESMGLLLLGSLGVVAMHRRRRIG